LHRFGSFLLLEVIQGSVLLGLGIALLFAGKGLPGVVWAELAAAACGAAGALRVVPRSSDIDAGVPVPWRDTVRRTFVFNLWPLLVNLYDRFDVILLSRLVSQAVAGVYAVPYRAFGALQIFPFGIMGSSLPGFSAKQWDQTQRERFHRLLGWLFALSAFLVLFAMLFADSAVQLLLGRAYHDSALVMKILIWAVVPAFLNNGMNMLLLARNREHVFLRTAGLCLAANLVANLVLIPRFSFIAAASVTIFTELLLLAQNGLLTRPLLGTWPWPRYWVRTSVAFGTIFGLASLAHSRASIPGLAVSLTAVSAFGLLLLYMDVLPARGIRAIFERAM
jgi:O-antigen/teichoic acid export membrane protein